MLKSEFAAHLRRLTAIRDVIEKLREDDPQWNIGTIQSIDYGLTGGEFKRAPIHLEPEACLQIFAGKTVSIERHSWKVSTAYYETLEEVLIVAHLGNKPFQVLPQLRSVTFNANGFIENLRLPEREQLIIKNEQDADAVLAMFDNQQQG